MLQKPEQLGYSIYKLEIEESCVKRRAPVIEQERSVAVRDLLRSNLFKPLTDIEGPYYLKMGFG